MTTPSGIPAKIALTGELPQPIQCCVCLGLVTLEQIERRTALLLWTAGVGCLALHRSHLSEDSASARYMTAQSLGKAIDELERQLLVRLDPRPSGQ